MNTTLSLLLFNILEAALSLTHQLTHHFFDCNSLSNLIKLSALIKRSQQGCVFKFKSRGTTMLPPPGLWEHLQFCCVEELGSTRDNAWPKTISNTILESSLPTYRVRGRCPRLLFLVPCSCSLKCQMI